MPFTRKMNVGCLDTNVEGSLNTSLRRIRRLGDWLRDLSFPRFTLLILTIEVLRLGLHWQRDPVLGYQEWAATWPSGSSWDTSPIWVLWSRVGFTDSLTWPVSWIVLVVVTLVTIAFLGHRYLTSWQARFLVLTVLASGIPLRLMEGVGHYDILFLLASISIAFPKKFIWITAAIIGGFANAEVAVIAGVGVILAALAFHNRTNVAKGLTFAASGALVALGVRIATELLGTEAGGRTAVFMEGVIPSLVGNLGWLPLILATGYLGAWFVVLFVIADMPGTRQILLLVSALVIVPVAMTLVTLDGTRVFVVTSAAALVLTIQTWVSKLPTTRKLDGRSSFSPSVGLAITFSVFVLVPEVSVFVLDPEVRLAPWELLVDVLYAVRPELLP